ncbi:MAG: aminopeptidase P family protein [Desulfatitalea sp.]|nr:Xaa-Pro peptidase family protein [Desulfatitalea sp.]NNK02046.1 aminopeptidase P family protein [Desulfatitalea sp.]
MDFQHTPREELYKRIEKLKTELNQNNIHGALIIQKADLFYFSGTCQNAHLFVPSEGEPVLFVKKSLERAQKESKIDSIEAMKNLKEMAEKIISMAGEKRNIGFELDVLPTNNYLYYKKLFPTHEIKDISLIIRKTRMIKSPYEIDRIKQAAELNYKMFSSIPHLLKEGITEVAFASRLEAIYRENGHQGAIRMRGFNQEIHYGHLMSGWNLSYPSFFDGPTGGSGLHPSFPQSAGFKKIKRNEPVMVDYVGVYQGYMVDQARIFSIGPLSEKLIRAHEAAIEIKNTIIENTRPGINGKDLYDLASNIAEKAGLSDHFMGYQNKISFIGHGVGIELDEFPIIAKNYDFVLEQGMVIALEPKFLFGDEGAVGIEDTLVVTDNCLDPITYFDNEIKVL